MGLGFSLVQQLPDTNGWRICVALPEDLAVESREAGGRTQHGGKEAAACGFG